MVAESKDYVCEVIRILDDQPFFGVVGLVDSDFDHIEEYMFESRNLIRTDGHDMECFLIASGALDALLHEFGSREKIELFGRDVRETLISATFPVGCLRLYSKRAGLNLRFSGLRYRQFVDESNLQTDRNALVQEVKNRSNRPDIREEHLLFGIGEIEAQQHDVWQICAGTDLVGVLSLGLRRTLGTNNTRDVRDEELRRALRLAFIHYEFATTDVFRALQRWEAENDPYRVLLAP